MWKLFTSKNRNDIVSVVKQRRKGGRNRDRSKKCHKKIRKLCSRRRHQFHNKRWRNSRIFRSKWSRKNYNNEHDNRLYRTNKRKNLSKWVWHNKKRFKSKSSNRVYARGSTIIWRFNNKRICNIYGRVKESKKKSKKRKSTKYNRKSTD